MTHSTRRSRLTSFVNGLKAIVVVAAMVLCAECFHFLVNPCIWAYWCREWPVTTPWPNRHVRAVARGKGYRFGNFLALKKLLVHQETNRPQNICINLQFEQCIIKIYLISVLPRFSKGQGAIWKGNFSAVIGPSKGNFSAVNGPSKGHFSAVNWRKRA